MRYFPEEATLIMSVIVQGDYGGQFGGDSSCILVALCTPPYDMVTLFRLLPLNITSCVVAQIVILYVLGKWWLLLACFTVRTIERDTFVPRSVP